MLGKGEPTRGVPESENTYIYGFPIFSMEPLDQGGLEMAWAEYTSYQFTARQFAEWATKNAQEIAARGEEITKKSVYTPAEAQTAADRVNGTNAGKAPNRGPRYMADGIGFSTYDQVYDYYRHKYRGVEMGIVLDDPNDIPAVRLWKNLPYIVEDARAEIAAKWVTGNALERAQLILDLGLVTSRGRGEAGGLRELPLGLKESLEVRWPEHMREIRNSGQIVAMGDRLPDSAIVVRGGLNSPQSIAAGNGVVVGPDGKITGLSVQSAGERALGELADRGSVPHNQIGVTTVGAIRAAGGDVVITPGRGFHAEVQGLTPEQMSRLFRIQPNPNPKPTR